AIPEGESRRRLLHEYGRFIDSLGGLYSCAPDMNTSAADMDVIADMTSYVFCKTEAAGGSGDTAPDTAVGVLHGIRASCRHAFGSDDLSRRSILVQGAGGVGGRLIELLTEADADRLHERGIDYAPDFVINAGGILHGGGLEEQHWTRQVLDAKLQGIGDALSDIFQRAEREGISTDTAARRIAVARIKSKAAETQALRARI